MTINKTLVDQLLLKKDILYKQLFEIEDRIETDTRTKKEKIRELAHTYEQLIDAKAITLRKWQICAEIIHRYKIGGYNEGSQRYVAEVLDDKYKNSSYISLYKHKTLDINELEKKALDKKSIEELEQEVEAKKNIWQDIENNIQREHLKPHEYLDVLITTKRQLDTLAEMVKNGDLIQTFSDSQLYDFKKFITSLEQKTEIEASKRNLNLENMEYYSNSTPDYSDVETYEARTLDPFKDKISTDSPEPRESPYYKALKDFGMAIITRGKTIIAIADHVYKYPPALSDNRVLQWTERLNDPILEEKLVTELIKAGSDLKYKRSSIQWSEIIDSQIDFGDHAGHARHPVIGVWFDKEKGEWQYEQRKVTREQVTDKAPEVIEFRNTMMEFLARKFPNEIKLNYRVVGVFEFEEEETELFRTDSKDRAKLFIEEMRDTKPKEFRKWESLRFEPVLITPKKEYNPRKFRLLIQKFYPFYYDMIEFTESYTIHYANGESIKLSPKLSNRA